MRNTLIVAMGCLVTCGVQAQQYGSWSVDLLKDKSAYYAATINDAGGLLGKVCDGSGCQWVMTVNTTCDEGSLYPALLSAATGAGPIKLLCSPNSTNQGRYIIKDYATMEGAVKSGEQIGIAMPLQSGEFRVARYQIGGWERAATALAGRVSTMIRKTGERDL